MCVRTLARPPWPPLVYLALVFNVFILPYILLHNFLNQSLFTVPRGDSSAYNSLSSRAQFSSCSSRAITPDIASFLSNKSSSGPRYDLKIFVYELPTEFNSDILKLVPQCEPSPFGSEVFVHKEFLRDVHKVRTMDPDEADFFFVPVYSACLVYSDFSRFDRYRKMIYSALTHIRSNYPFWNRTRGRDHVWPFVHDYGGCLSWADNTEKVFFDELRHSIFLSHLGDLSMGCFSSYKDIVIPPLVSSPRIARDGKGGINVNLTEKSTFAHFRGTISWYHHSTMKSLGIFRGYSRSYSHGVRFYLKSKFQGDPLVKVFEGPSENYVKEVENSVFCLCPRGFAPWSRRLFDSMMLGCIPVIIADDIELPFEDVLNYRSFSVKVMERDLPSLKEILLAITPERIREMQLNLQQAWKFVSYQNPSQPGDAFDMILYHLHKQKRPFKPAARDGWS